MSPRTSLRHPWRMFRIALGLLLVTAGTIVTPTPVPVGLAVTAAGVGILLVESRAARRALYSVRRRYPRFSARVRWLGEHLPGRARRVLQRTDPWRRRSV